jgi:hypothetical protein
VTAPGLSQARTRSLFSSSILLRCSPLVPSSHKPSRTLVQCQPQLFAQTVQPGSRIPQRNTCKSPLPPRRRLPSCPSSSHLALANATVHGGEQAEDTPTCHRVKLELTTLLCSPSSPFTSVNLPDRTWPDKRITKAPRWASSDLRDGNQVSQLSHPRQRDGALYPRF